MATAQNNLLNTIQEDSISALVNISSANQELQKINQKGAEISSEIAELRRSQAADKALIETTQQTAALRAQQGIAKAALAAGVNPMAEADVISKTLGVMHEQGDKFQTAAMNYEANKQGDIISLGPVEWFKKRWESGNNRQEMESAEKQYSIASQRLQNVNNLVQASARTYMATTESLNSASIQALTRVAATDSEIQARNAELEGLKYNAAGIASASNASKEQLNVLYNLSQAQSSERSYQLQLENSTQNRALQLENSQQNRALLREKFDYKKEADAAKQSAVEEETYFAQRINVGRGNRGLPPMTGRDMGIMVKTLRSGGFGAKELQEDYDRGVATLVTGVPYIGNSAAETANVLAKNKTALPEKRQNVAKLLVQARDKVMQDPRTAGSKPEEQAAAINKLVAEQINQQFINIKPGADNLFDVGDMKNYLTLNDSIINMPVVKEILAPAAEKGQNLSDPSQVISLAAQGVLDKKITTSQAYAVTDLFRSANEVHLAANGFVAMGVPIPGRALNYNLRGIGNLNVTDAAAMARTINKLLAARAYEQMIPVGSGGAVQNTNSVFDPRTGRLRAGFGGMSPGTFGQPGGQ